MDKSENYVENRVEDVVESLWMGCGRTVDRDFIHRKAVFTKITYTQRKICCKIKLFSDALWK